jgi:hypothetical protein
MFFQRPVQGGRERLYSGVERRVKERLESLAIRYNVTKSFVSNSILAEALGVHLAETYKEVGKRKKLRSTKRKKVA